MRVEKAVLTVLAAAVWAGGCQAATSASVRLCGRKLSEMMSRVCHEYNSPSWDDPVVEQPGGVRRRRQVAGIADECCTHGCTFEQLTDYCSISTNSESTLEALEAHMIADRSAEAAAPASEADRVRDVPRAAPVVGTVSPLLTWGRTLHAELPPVDLDRYAYVAVYSRP
ncbi:insulin isoform X6 [Plutella xylostella]|uniref:insulin isoform X6 n=1 Tax=Plutella xylostella TaxID=51655 RepID=UPI00203230D3|nr:insulin isoform X6 [Plutella xylostella]